MIVLRVYVHLIAWTDVRDIADSAVSLFASYYIFICL